MDSVFKRTLTFSLLWSKLFIIDSHWLSYNGVRTSCFIIQTQERRSKKFKAKEKLHKSQHQHGKMAESPSSDDGAGGGNRTLFKVHWLAIDQIPMIPPTGIYQVLRVSTKSGGYRPSPKCMSDEYQSSFEGIDQVPRESSGSRWYQPEGGDQTSEPFYEKSYLN